MSRALHPLLFAHPEGVTVDDVADELALERADAEVLLTREARAGSIELACTDDGTVLYRTRRRIRPQLSLAAARHVDHRARVFILALTGLVAFAAIAIAILLRHEPPRVVPAPVVQTNHVEEVAAAARAAEQRKIWREELDGLVAVEAKTPPRERPRIAVRIAELRELLGP